MPKDTFLWKLNLLKSGTAYTNSRLHAVVAEVLVLASGKDNVLPSGDEADRLWRSLKYCKVRYFKDNGHALLLEDGINLLSIIKGSITYRRSRQHDFVTDYLPPTISEFRRLLVQNYRFLLHGTSSVFFSTLENGRIVRGLSGVPSEGPVLLVGYHMLMGLELVPLYETFLREKKVVMRGMAHPYLFARSETSREEFSHYDLFNIFGGLPISPINMYRLFSRKSFILLYPGGVREALHRKGEEYKLFWPDHPEFVRMAARFEATIIPFGVVGEDDVAELFLDYNDLMDIPFAQRWIKNFNQDTIGTRLRTDENGEISEQDMHLPGILPKLPGRFYYMFGKPITTRGKDILKDRKSANELYLQIKSAVEGSMSYLKRKREEDPYRSIVQRAIYQKSWGSASQVPTFEP